MILSSQAGTLYWHHFARTKKALPEDENQAFKNKQVDRLRRNKEVERIIAKMFDVELDISKMQKLFFLQSGKYVNSIQLCGSIFPAFLQYDGWEFLKKLFGHTKKLRRYYVKHISGVIIQQKRLTSSDFVLEKLNGSLTYKQTPFWLFFSSRCELELGGCAIH